VLHIYIYIYIYDISNLRVNIVSFICLSKKTLVTSEAVSVICYILMIGKSLRVVLDAFRYSYYATFEYCRSVGKKN
jgi:hypothetical protein